MKILQEFDVEEEWVLAPGDLLYVPPNVGHWGIAQSDDCVTYSIGFRAPSQSEILLGFSQFVAEELSADQRFSDPELQTQEEPGEIKPWVIEKFKRHLQALINDDVQLTEWVGRFATEVKRQAPPSAEVLEGLRLSPACRAAYVVQDDGVLLFVNGEVASCSVALATALCSYQALIPSRYNAEDQELIEQMREAGWLNDSADH
jgi:50S ribosomal protein L16 3-hydroxylase